MASSLIKKSKTVDDDDDGDDGLDDGGGGANSDAVDDDWIIYGLPIVVGYAFGPKKMSTMGVVMAEASKTKLRRVRSASALVTARNALTGDEENEDDLQVVIASDATTTSNHDNHPDRRSMEMTELETNESNDITPPDGGSSISPLTRESLTTHNDRHQQEENTNDDVEDRDASKHEDTGVAADATVVFTIDGGQISSLSTTKGGKSNYDTHHGNARGAHKFGGGAARGQGSAAGRGLRSIVRHFRSSCSSIDEDSSTAGSTGTICTTNTNHSNAATNGSSCPTTTVAAQQLRGGSGGNTTQPQQHHHLPVRVSFVPLDPELPLQEQHGGMMDVVLHKLTEDILCLSQLSQTLPVFNDVAKSFPTSQHLERYIEEHGLKGKEHDEHDQDKHGSPSTTGDWPGAVRRVYRLLEFSEQQQQQLHHKDSSLSSSLGDGGGCYLVDDPVRVQTLMSRADIASTLSTALSGLRTTSGLPVGSPRSCVVVVDDDNPRHDDGDGMMANAIELSGLSFPIIIKPLIAAGTKASHSMAVILDRSSLDRWHRHRRQERSLSQLDQLSKPQTSTSPQLQREEPTATNALEKTLMKAGGGTNATLARSNEDQRDGVSDKRGDGRIAMGPTTTKDPKSASSIAAPCLCQEYVNHDATLYKVYVLGDYVSVHKRRSMPNVPTDHRGHHLQREEGDITVGGNEDVHAGWVEFDSQRPYPRLSEFGLLTTAAAAGSGSASTPPETIVTAEEVKPVVDALKKAFGLELFGFDVLVTSRDERYRSGYNDQNEGNDGVERQSLLVVDVNYFPSYKEVPNFPALLARYLVDCAIDNRRRRRLGSHRGR